MRAALLVVTASEPSLVAYSNTAGWAWKMVAWGQYCSSRRGSSGAKLAESAAGRPVVGSGTELCGMMIARDSLWVEVEHTYNTGSRVWGYAYGGTTRTVRVWGY